MSHPIFVCLKHKLTFHTAGVAGRHAVSHGARYDGCLDEGVFVKIGECFNPLCGKDRLLPATDGELQQAHEKRSGEKG